MRRTLTSVVVLADRPRGGVDRVSCLWVALTAVAQALGQGKEGEGRAGGVPRRTDHLRAAGRTQRSRQRTALTWTAGGTERAGTRPGCCRYRTQGTPWMRRELIAWCSELWERGFGGLAGGHGCGRALLYERDGRQKGVVARGHTHRFQKRCLSDAERPQGKDRPGVASTEATGFSSRPDGLRRLFSREGPTLYPARDARILNSHTLLRPVAK